MKSATLISSAAASIRFLAGWLVVVCVVVAAPLACAAPMDAPKTCVETNGQLPTPDPDSSFKSPDWVLGSCQAHPIAGYKCVSAVCGFGDVVMLPASEEMILYSRDAYAERMGKTYPGDPTDLRRKLISFTPQINGITGWVAISEVTRNGVTTMNVTGVTRFQDARGAVVPVALVSEAQSRDAAQRNFAALASAAKLTLSFGDEVQK